MSLSSIYRIKFVSSFTLVSNRRLSLCLFLSILSHPPHMYQFILTNFSSLRRQNGFMDDDVWNLLTYGTRIWLLKRHICWMCWQVKMVVILQTEFTLISPPWTALCNGTFPSASKNEIISSRGHPLCSPNFSRISIEPALACLAASWIG